MAEDKKKKSSGKGFPMHANYGKITRYQDVPITVPMQCQGQTFELAPTFVYLASDDSCFVTGQTLLVNGGESTSS
ncbi:Glucose 1-dehydrogenase [Peribacillus sp. Bi96]|nr:Glucose 1-dehydrogenase [Peribacillus sp. Bi96]